MPFRRQEATRDGIMQASMSSSSLSSSFSSSAGSSMLQPAAPPSNSSQSDIGTLDHSVQSSPSTHPKVFFPPNTIKPAPRSSSLQVSMGQTGSRPEPRAPPTSPTKSGSSTPTASSRLKRVFAVRKKKGEYEPDYNPSPLSMPMVKGRSVTMPFAGSGHRVPAPPITLSSPDLPPTPPAKSPHMLANMGNSSGRGSVMVVSPGITPALQYLSQSEKDHDMPAAVTRPAKKDLEHEKMKDDWRKSDSTMTSYYTVRPRSMTSGDNRTPRPVSMAESLHSTNTIVPANKRLSALLTEAEFIMTEEEVSMEPANSVDSGHSTRRGAMPLARTTSPSGSSKTRKRHSISLHFSSPFPSSPPASSSPSPSASETHYAGVRPQFVPHTTEATSDVAARGIIGSSRGEDSAQSTGSHIKGRLAAFSAAPSSYQGHTLPDRPASPSHHSAASGTGLRQTAISMSNGFAPAAGFAKRAVERMGRAFGSLSSNHSNSGYSSSSSSLTESADGSSARGNTSSSHLTPTAQLGKGKQRRTPNAPSGTWSISTTGTSSTGADQDTFGLASGPSLGTRIRGPMRIAGSGASVVGGLVFGRELRACVRDTALDSVRQALSNGVQLGGVALEERLLPALVVRCAQHLMKWGVEEEGLFRISGRASHIARLRSEFDTGADYDMLECAPGDLDPHAVSSIFKAYLRELPEPILTHALNPFFEAAMIAETNARKSEEPPLSPTKMGGRGPGLPSGPRSGHVLRKPLSLSTLAMPSFAGIRPPSKGLLNVFASLVSRLPQENRDLLRTVTELINFTSQRKEIRMPLSNLTVVFCPSLNMSPPILRVLCEAEGIWDAHPKDDAPVIDIKRDEDVVLNISAPDTSDQTTGDEDEDNGESNKASLAPHPLELPVPSDEQTPPFDDRKQDVVPRIDINTQDTEMQDIGSVSAAEDDVSYGSTAESRPSTPPSNPPRLYNPHSPPALSTSSDSLATPSTISEDPSLPPPADPVSEPKTDTSAAPIIADAGSLPPLMPSRPAFASITPVAFPYADNAPASPTSPAQSSRISLPLERDSSEPSQNKLGRGKRPSLTALFSTRSVSSLRSSMMFLPSPTFLSAQGSPAGSSSPSTPASMVTAPQGSASSLPPVLDTDIDSSRLDLGLGVEDDKDRASEETMGRDLEAETDEKPPTSRQPSPSRPPLASPVSPATSVTPVAGQFSQDSDQPKASFSPGERLRTKTSQASFASGVSTTTYHRLSLWEDDDDVPPDEDWASSVIMAADMGWSPSEPTERGHGDT